VIVHTLHGIHYLHYRNVFLKRAYILLEKIFSRFSDAVIFVCDSDRNSARKYGLVPEDKGVVINNGLDWSVFDRLEGKPLEKQNWEKELGIGLSSPVVGTVARLHRQKGLTYLLQAARLLSERIPGIKILVVGGGPLKSKLEEQKRRLKLEGTVYFLGERRDASRLLSLFDVFVLPSLWEGLPYSLMEAGALGKPVVAAAVDGVKEMIIDGRTGVLVPPKHAEKLALAVCRLLEDRAWARKMGSALQVGLRDKYSLFRMVKETQSLYLRLYHKKTSRS
jgi:glycosyltransferase involved in cell wall biosynthesis